MLAGHFAVGLAAKRIEGVEQVAIRPGMRGAANYFVMADVPWSHSLCMNVVWGAVVAAVFFALWGNRRGAWVLFAAVVSHWVLDFVSSPPNLPLAPGLPGRFGLGLWGSVPLTLMLEGGAWLAAIILYMRGTQARGRAGVAAFWIGVAFLTFIWYDNIAGLPHAPRPDPIGAFIVFSLLVAWAYWMNRARSARS